MNEVKYDGNKPKPNVSTNLLNEKVPNQKESKQPTSQ
jgi:hypothetical protein